MKSARGAGRDKNLAVWIVIEGVIAKLLLCYGLAQSGDAIESSIDIVPVTNSLNRCFFNDRGERCIADALSEIDSADAIALNAHGADLRLQDTWRKLTEGE